MTTTIQLVRNMDHQNIHQIRKLDYQGYVAEVVFSDGSGMVITDEYCTPRAYGWTWFNADHTRQQSKRGQSLHDMTNMVHISAALAENTVLHNEDSHLAAA